MVFNGFHLFSSHFISFRALFELFWRCFSSSSQAPSLCPLRRCAAMAHTSLGLKSLSPKKTQSLPPSTPLVYQRVVARVAPLGPVLRTECQQKTSLKSSIVTLRESNYKEISGGDVPMAVHTAHQDAPRHSGAEIMSNLAWNRAYSQRRPLWSSLSGRGTDSAASHRPRDPLG